ncbi:unnamed protein product [Rhizoctonia solani]|uniref:Uncharacterized protein n=1 Tax=Rhizoctonia solani TaxID=456999 RepID=A0A8H3A8U6_9AGAM|nr:unnamed protein product [Rhizoctonia solani]
MSSRTRSNLGRPISTYILDYSGNKFLARNITKSSYSLNHIKNIVIPQLEEAIELSDDICSIFLEVLCLVYYPNELNALNNTTLLSSCIRTLRKFVAENQNSRNFKLFSHETGFLCFQTIVLLVQIGILAHTNNLDRFRLMFHPLVSQPEEMLISLAELGIVLMERSEHEPNARRSFLGPFISQTGQRTFLKSVGGFTDSDAEFLLKLLWQDRKRFSELCVRVQSPGWALLLLVIGAHMQWKSESAYIPYGQWMPLETLCFRYSLHSSASEADAIGVFCEETVQDRPDHDEEPDDECYEKSLVDAEDARGFLLAFIDRTDLFQPLPVSLGRLVLRFFRQELIIESANLIAVVIGNTCSHIWTLLETTAGDSEHLSTNVGFNQYATQLFGLIDRFCSAHATSPDMMSTIARILSKKDFVNLFGRLVLLSLSVGSPLGRLSQTSPSSFSHLDRKQPPYNIARSWFDLAFEAVEFMHSCGQTGNQFQVAFDSSFPDWMKLRRCLDANFPQHQAAVGSKAFEKHVQGTRATLLKMAHPFGYSEPVRVKIRTGTTWTNLIA